ncbi:aldo/keto reductase [Streptomyces sp. H27-C3]|uniref:aldo/keto reductase n=1 Tax=Streptomyces sp. H27-C3 TaxID=3046305 RepID=UPI0024BB48B1|nr:aldo/keto reductase [Streptomyces sp. H27-C3]MDJ0466574.1 aldo/keto reductase [Streptomyces sp. H27-C3]
MDEKIGGTAQPVRMSEEIFRIGGDLPVHRLGFGAMRLSDGPGPSSRSLVWSAPQDPARAQAVLRRAVELGVDLIDTADAYGVGANEELVASALRPYPDPVVISTKVGVVRPAPTEWVPMGNPEYLKQQAELSLRRLGVEQLDLLFLHRIDPKVPLADQIGAFKELQAAGKVRHIGLSEVSVEEIEEAERITPVAAVQSLYNVADRGNESVIDHCAARGIAFLAYFPLAIGAHALDDGPLAEVARKIGATPAQTALAWLLHRHPCVLPIPGTALITHLEENQAALDIELTPEQFGRLSETF